MSDTFFEAAALAAVTAGAVNGAVALSGARVLHAGGLTSAEEALLGKRERQMGFRTIMCDVLRKQGYPVCESLTSSLNYDYLTLVKYFVLFLTLQPSQVITP